MFKILYLLLSYYYFFIQYRVESIMLLYQRCAYRWLETTMGTCSL